VRDVPEEAEETDRAYWEKKRDPASMSVMDKIVQALKTPEIEQRLSYNKHHIALGSTGNNFCWFHPRKTPGYCHVEFKLTPDTRDQALATMQTKGIDASSRGAARIHDPKTFASRHNGHFFNCSAICVGFADYRLSLVDI
jgi:hypothetical protein